MKVLLELSNLLQNKSSNKIVSQLEALKKIKEVLKPGKLFPGQPSSIEPPPRVQVPRVHPTEAPPRVEQNPRADLAESQIESIASRLLSRRAKPIETANPVLDYETGKLLEYRQLLKHPKYSKAWSTSAANEFGRLAQGVGGRVKGTNTIFFIKFEEIPLDRRRDVTYINFVCNVRTEKSEPNRTRATAGGNLINYPEDVGTPTANLLLVKILLNSVISTKGAKFATADISNFYLETPLKRPEYARVRLSDIPEEIIREYNLKEVATPEGWVYMRIVRGMYGLPQAGANAHDELSERLEKEGYYQSNIIPGLWKHKTRPTLFALIVDDFGIKYMSEDDLNHLIKTLQQYYDVTVDYDGKEYVKIELDWDYEKGLVHLSMAPYLKKALAQFQVEKPKKPVNSPYAYVPPKYGAKEQFAETDDSPAATKEDQTLVQKVTGKFNWYGRAVDSTLLTPLSALASQQSKPTTKTMERVKQFLEYAATQEPAVLTFRRSGMVLAIHSDAGYLNEPNARSRAGGHFFLSEDVEDPPNNGAIHNNAEIIKAVMSSAAEAEIGSAYQNARKGVEIRNILQEMGHKQPPTPMQIDNSTADGICNLRVQPKQTKAMDMRFHWLRDREAQEQFRIYWRPGKANRGDYWTKHHPPSHHVEVRPEILTSYKTLMDFRTRQKGGLQGCVKFAAKQ
jgi:uncharacterized protein YaaQ